MREGLFLIFLSINLSFAIEEMIISIVDMNGNEIKEDITLAGHIYVKLYNAYDETAFLTYKCSRVNDFTRPPTGLRFLMRVKQSYHVKYAQVTEIYSDIYAIRNFTCQFEDEDPRNKYHYLYMQPLGIINEILAKLTVSCQIKLDKNDNELSLYSVGQDERLEDHHTIFRGHPYWIIREQKALLRSYLFSAKRYQCEYESDPEGEAGSVALRQFKKFAEGNFPYYLDPIVDCEYPSVENYDKLVETLLSPTRHKAKYVMTFDAFLTHLEEEDTKFFNFFPNDDVHSPMCIDARKLKTFYDSSLSENSQFLPDIDYKEEVCNEIIDLLKDPNQKVFSANHEDCILDVDKKQFEFSNFINENVGNNGFVGVFENIHQLIADDDDLLDDKPDKFEFQCLEMPEKNTIERQIHPNQLTEILADKDVFLAFIDGDEIPNCYYVNYFLELEMDEINSYLRCPFTNIPNHFCVCVHGEEATKQILFIPSETDINEVPVIKELTHDSNAENPSSTTDTLYVKLLRNEQREEIELQTLRNLLVNKYFLFFNEHPICHKTEDFILHWDCLKSLKPTSSITAAELQYNNHIELMDLLGKQNDIFSTSLEDCLSSYFVKRLPQFELDFVEYHYPIFDDQLQLTQEHSTAIKAIFHLTSANPITSHRTCLDILDEDVTE